MRKFKKIFSIIFLTIFLLFQISNISIWADYDSELEDTTNNINWSQLKGIVDNSSEGEEITNFIVYILKKVIIPICITIWAIIAIVGFLKIMFTESDDEQKKWKNYLLWWSIGIIIMTSSFYITNILIWKSWLNWIIIDSVDMKDWAELAKNLYSDIMFPFIKMWIIIIAWIMFVILLIQAIKFLFSPSEEIKTKSKTIVIWNTIGILIIILAKEIVENIYWKQNQIETSSSSINIWSGIMSQQNFTTLFNIINWALWLIAFLVVVLIIYQTYLVLIKPDDSDNLKKLKRNFIYIFIGLILIAWGYLITNFFIIK